MELPFHTLDVFTDRTFGGNPLGVFPGAADLPDSVMQRIAREMNLSETVFLGPAATADGTRRVRIFTPAVEVPFAGHPTVGTAHFLAATGAVELPEGGTRVVLEENVGPVAVEIGEESGAPGVCRLTAAIPPEHRECPWTARDLGRMVGLPEDAVGSEPAPGTSPLEPELVSVGLPYIVLPVRDLESVRRARLDLTVWEDLTRGAWSRMVYVVAPETEGRKVDLHVRMFAPAAGVPEDPATGSAAAALAAYLGRRTKTDGSYRWTLEQGLEIGRPSRLVCEADVAEGEVTAVRVGGRSVLVSRGTMTVPDALIEADAAPPPPPEPTP